MNSKYFFTLHFLENSTIISEYILLLLAEGKMGRLSQFFTKDKIHAFLIHLGISLVIFSVLLYFILVEWYPQPLFNTDGGWQGIRLIAFVDIVLGPVLTLVVFKKGKPRLKLDLGIIAAIQISALISGVFVVYGEHPVAVVLLQNRLTPITANQFSEAGIDLKSLYRYSDLRPPIIFARVPQDETELAKLTLKISGEGRSLRLAEELYEKLTDKNKKELKKQTLAVAKYVESDEAKSTVFNDFLNKDKYKNHSLIYFPLYSRYEYGIAVLDSDTFEILDILHILPPDLGEEF
ncbi:MAG: hypothetical protein ACC653_03875 [Gammaproteobacteria bacterium]